MRVGGYRASHPSRLGESALHSPAMGKYFLALVSVPENHLQTYNPQYQDDGAATNPIRGLWEVRIF
jgi:hypothetical protein